MLLAGLLLLPLLTGELLLLLPEYGGLLLRLGLLLLFFAPTLGLLPAFLGLRLMLLLMDLLGLKLRLLPIRNPINHQFSEGKQKHTRT